MMGDKPENKEITMETGTAHLYVLFMIIPVALLFLAPYYVFWKEHLDQRYLLKAVQHFHQYKFVYLLVLGVGIILHELIHGITWALFCKNGWKSIRFGMQWKYFAPYCHCDEYLMMLHYRLGSIMPAVVLGFIPFILSLITGNIGFLIFGILFSVTAGGDLIILWMLKGFRKDVLVLDHPDKLGCVVQL